MDPLDDENERWVEDLVARLGPCRVCGAKLGLPAPNAYVRCTNGHPYDPEA